MTSAQTAGVIALAIAAIVVYVLWSRIRMTATLLGEGWTWSEAQTALSDGWQTADALRHAGVTPGPNPSDGGGSTGQRQPG